MLTNIPINKKFKCLYHKEKTPSANIWIAPDGTKFYHCFGCQTSIPLFKALMDHEGYTYIQACQALNIPINENIEKKAKKEIIKLSDRQLIASWIEEKYPRAIYFIYDFQEYYKLIIKISDQKFVHFCQIINNNIILNIDNIDQKPYNFDIPNQNAKIIITEGEKDVETIKNILQIRDFQTEPYHPISFNGLKQEIIDKYMQQLSNVIDTIYFLGDNDHHGKKYLEQIHKATPTVKNLLIIDINAKDISAWVDSARQEISLTDIRKEFAYIINQPHQNYKRSKIWAIFDEKIIYDKKTEQWIDMSIPKAVPKNITSFFRFTNTYLKRDSISKKIFGDYGLLNHIKDTNNSTDGFDYQMLLEELSQTRIDNDQKRKGLKIKDEASVAKLVQSYLRTKEEDVILKKISAKPVKTTLTHKIGEYPIPPIFNWLINNITFIGNDREIQFQKILLWKTLLNLPRMLNNSKANQYKIFGILYLIGENGIGKSDFIKGLFDIEAQAPFMNKVQSIKLKDRDSIKLAFQSPCCFLDEGSIYGSIQEKKAFFDSPSYEYIEKYKTNITEITKKTIFIASSNSQNIIEDIEGERRLWIINVAKLPYLQYLTKSYYDPCLGKVEIHNKYFKFPALEFWRQIYNAYLYYKDNNILEKSLILNTQELIFYKIHWAVKNYQFSKIEDALLNLHDWDQEPIFINNLDIILENHFGFKPILNQEYKKIINALKKSNCDFQKKILPPLKKKYNPLS